MKYKKEVYNRYFQKGIIAYNKFINSKSCYNIKIKFLKQASRYFEVCLKFSNNLEEKQQVKQKINKIENIMK